VLILCHVILHKTVHVDVGDKNEKARVHLQVSLEFPSKSCDCKGALLAKAKLTMSPITDNENIMSVFPP
jgi:hypothetical protein